jgi:hypothetical protein
MRVGLFAYPWDLLDEGPEAAIEQMATRWHCDSLLLNAIYHHARLLRPRWDGPKVFELEVIAATGMGGSRQSGDRRVGVLLCER